METVTQPSDTTTTAANTGTQAVTLTQEPAAASPAPASKQDATGSAGSANGATTTKPAPADTKATAEADWEWNGNVDEVEAPFRKRALGIQRYLTKRSQELADAQRKAEELDRIKSDPNISNYLNSQTRPQNGHQAQQPNPSQIVSPQEWEQLGLDPAVGQAINKMIETRIESARAEVGGMMSQLTQKQAHMERTQEIQDFGEVHPDMWELYDAGILGPVVREVVDTKRGTLTDAYNLAKGIRDKFRNEAIQKSQERVQQKKAAFSSTPSPASESDVIWVDNPQDSYRIAFENALQNKRVTVKTRR